MSTPLLDEWVHAFFGASPADYASVPASAGAADSGPGGSGGGPGGMTPEGATLGGLPDGARASTTDGSAQAELVKIAIEPDRTKIRPEHPQPFTAIGEFDDGTSRDITDEVNWTSSNAAISFIGSGIASARPATASATIR